MKKIPYFNMSPKSDPKNGSKNHLKTVKNHFLTLKSTKKGVPPDDPFRLGSEGKHLQKWYQKRVKK